METICLETRIQVLKLARTNKKSKAGLLLSMLSHKNDLDLLATEEKAIAYAKEVAQEGEEDYRNMTALQS